MRARRVVMCIELDTNARRTPATGDHQFAEFIEGMLTRVMHQRLGKTDDVVIGKVGRYARGFGVLCAPEPDRGGFLEVHQHRLGRVERPAIETGEPTHAGRILANQQIEASALHALFYSCDSLFIFSLGERFLITHV